MDGIERLKILGKDIKDEALLKILNYLISRTDMNEKYLNEEKSLSEMINFIKKNAKERAVNNMAIINDDEVYGWAIHYFDESNENLGIIRVKKVENKPIKNETIKKEPESKTKGWEPEGQLSLFDLI